MAMTQSTQTVTAADGKMSSRKTARPVIRRDLELYPTVVHPPSPLPPTTARVTFQHSQKDKDNSKSGSTRDSGVRDFVLAEERWSWDEEDNDEKAKDWMRARSTFDVDLLSKNNSNSCNDPVEGLLDRLYGNDDQSDDNGNRFRGPQGNERWWDKSYSNPNHHRDMVAEWQRHAFQFVEDSCLLNDGDQVVRVDGEDGSGTLLYDLASCR